jgi:NTP pyrophosphatase (non-canonical NTP hydrolase)
VHLSDLCKSVHEWAVGKGWWEPWERNFPEQLCLMHSELSEALEEYRRHGMKPEAFLYTHHCKESGEYEFREGHKPEGIASEIADVVIRIADTCQRYNIDLEAAIEAKMAYNHTREYRHGGKLA